MSRRKGASAARRVGTVAAGVALASASAAALGPSSAGAGTGTAATTGSTIYACYSDTSGEMFRVTATTTCPSGETKISWPALGPQGAAGSPDAQGSPGPQGVQGKPGLQGSQGTIGTQGASGERGPLGAAGPPGTRGSKGATGPQGAGGPPGSQGTTGPLGPQGPPGAINGYSAATSKRSINHSTQAFGFLGPPVGNYDVQATATWSGTGSLHCQGHAWFFSPSSQGSPIPVSSVPGDTTALTTARLANTVTVQGVMHIRSSRHYVPGVGSYFSDIVVTCSTNGKGNILYPTTTAVQIAEVTGSPSRGAMRGTVRPPRHSFIKAPRPGRHEGAVTPKPS